MHFVAVATLSKEYDFSAAFYHSPLHLHVVHWKHKCQP